MGFVWFLLGAVFGGCLGVLVMCMFQIGKYNRYEEQIREIEEQLKIKK